MKRPRLSAYQAIALVAVLHCVVVWVCFRFGGALKTWWGIRLWVGLFTLWPFWLVILLFHRGRKLWLAFVSITVSLLLLLPLLRFYDFFAGEKVFGWPRGFSVEPITAVAWTRAYLAGRTDAKKDIQNGRLVIEEYGFGAGTGNRFRILRDRYCVELKATAQCEVDCKILGHAVGYNSVSEPEIGRRYGPTAIRTVFEEGSSLDVEQWARQHQRERDWAKTVSSMPPDGKIVLSWIKLFDDNVLIETDLPATEMSNVSNIVHWVESEVNSREPADAPEFKGQITVELFANSRPQLSEGSMSYLGRNDVPDIRSERNRLSVMMQFGDHARP
jgi:hypothetical protein